MPDFGYYEIIRHMARRTGLKMNVMAGNVMFNRHHWHDSLEIMCCLSGSFSVHYHDSTCTLYKGDLITFNSGERHEIFDGTPGGLQLIFSVDASLLRISEGEQYDFSTVGVNALDQGHMDIRTVRSSVASLACMLMPDTSNVINLGREAAEKYIFDFWSGALDTDEQWYQYHIELYQILMCLSRHKRAAEPEEGVSKPARRFNQCVELIHQNYDKQLSAKSISEEIGFSEPTIYRLFKNHMGISFNEYLNSVRISAACGLIENTDESMTEIAASCGYTSLSNFYRAFQQFVGLSPREYKKNRGTNQIWQKGFQKDLMLQNRFQPFWELPYTYEDLIRLTK